MRERAGDCELQLHIMPQKYQILQQTIKQKAKTLVIEQVKETKK
jgi:hypothetical protein